MAFGLRAAKGLVGAKKEATPYTAETLAGADAFPAYDISVTINSNDYARKELQSHFGKQFPVSGMGETEISFKILHKDLGANVYTPPWFGILLRACGMLESSKTTITLGTTYTPTTLNWGVADSGSDPALKQGILGLTVGVWLDGIHIKAGGCMGNCVITAKAGDPVEYAFTFKGAFITVSDAAMPTPTLGLAVVPPQFVSATFSLGATALPIETVSVDFGNVLSKLIDANNSAGLKGFLVTDRAPVAKINPELALVADFDFYGKARASTSQALAFGPFGATKKQLTFTAPTCALKMPSIGEREGMRIVDVEVALLNATVTDGAEFSLFYT